MINSGTFRRLFNSSLLKPFRRFAREERGQSVVEGALSLMMLMMLIFGVIETSWAIYSDHYVANVAHEAARFAMVRGGGWTSACDGTGTQSMCVATTDDVRNFVANRNFPGITITAAEVHVQYFATLPSSTSQSCSADSTGTLANAAGDAVQVTICHPFTLTVPLIPAITWQLTSTSQMVIAQ